MTGWGRAGEDFLRPIIHRHAQLLELAVQRAPLHAHESSRLADIAAKAQQLSLQILNLEEISRRMRTAGKTRLLTGSLPYEVVVYGVYPKNGPGT